MSLFDNLLADERTEEWMELQQVNIPHTNISISKIHMVL